MNQCPQVIFADALADCWPQAGNQHGWVLARPLSCGGFFTRLELAWRVFTGQYDALAWSDLPQGKENGND